MGKNEDRITEVSYEIPYITIRSNAERGVLRNEDIKIVLKTTGTAGNKQNDHLNLRL
jgi:hypothetical protein